MSKQTDCFKINMKFYKFLGLYPGEKKWRFYNHYSTLFLIVIIMLYQLLLTVNLYFLPRQLDRFIEEMLFYFVEISVTSKVLTFVLQRDKIKNILSRLEIDTFYPKNAAESEIINKAKSFIVSFWKTIAVISTISSVTNMIPLFVHVFSQVDLELPICSYSFLSEDTIEKFVYPLFFYQSFGMHCHMWCNVNIDTFFLGLMILVIAQLDVLEIKLRHLAENVGTDEEGDKELTGKLNEAIKHFGEISKFCDLVQDVFSATLFVQIGMASMIICVCLFRFTMPATIHYYIFLATYMLMMLVQVMLPCWFGTRIMDKSCKLASAIYDSDWTPRSNRFKSSFRILVERFNQPLCIIGGKMFPLSLETFTSIMNSAYSFFTLLRHMQSREA